MERISGPIDGNIYLSEMILGGIFAFTADRKHDKRQYDMQQGPRLELCVMCCNNLELFFPITMVILNNNSAGSKTFHYPLPHQLVFCINLSVFYISGHLAFVQSDFQYFIHSWRWLTCKVSTSTSGAVQYLAQGHFSRQTKGIEPATSQ